MKGKFTEVKGTAQDLANWHALLSSDDAPAFTGLLSIADPDDFAGRLRRNYLDHVTAALIQTRASEHTLRRAAEHIAATPEPGYMVMFQLAGKSVFQEGDNPPAELRAGSFAISATNNPHLWTFTDGRVSVFSLRFPQSLIDVPEQVLKRMAGRALSPQQGIGKHLASFVSAVASDDELLVGPTGARVARNLIDLVGTGLVAEDQRVPPQRSVPLFAQVTNYIGDHLADPRLDASSVAAACHISVRYLQVMFHEQGTTVTDWIRGRRLAGSRRDLADPALRDAAIGDIAFRWGYPDPAYFSRLFRRAFGESPREFRARALRYRVASQRTALREQAPSRGHARPGMAAARPAGQPGTR